MQIKTFLNSFRKYFCLILLLFAFPATAQDSLETGILPKKVKHRLQIRHDNDFMALTDRYYSFGLMAGYTLALDRGLFATGKEQLYIELMQGAITPGDKKAEAIEEMDRPYVGFLTLNSGWSYASRNFMLRSSLLTGLGGPGSGAGSFQQWYHNSVVVSDPPTWSVEMKNNFYLNGYADITREWKLSPNPFSIYLALNGEVAFGSKDVYTQPELSMYFGRRNSLPQSMAYGQIGTTQREIFFSLTAGYRYVHHNAFLQGSTLNSDYLFTVNPEQNLLYAGFDFMHRFEQNEYWVGFRMNSPETANSGAHHYFIFSYARNF